MPDTIVIGNSRPFAPWMVRMRTASSSVSGSTVSTTPCALGALEVGPAQEVARSAAAARRRSENARAWSTTNRTRRHRSRGRPCANADFEHAALAHDAVEQLTRRRATAARRASARERARSPRPPGGRAAASRATVAWWFQRPWWSTLERVEVVVAAAEQRRAQRGDEARARRWGRRRPASDDQQVADLARAVDERRRLRPVRDAARRRARPRVDRSDVRAGSRIAMSPSRHGSQTRVVAASARPASPRSSAVRDGGGDVGRLALAQRVGAQPVARAPRPRAARGPGPTGTFGASRARAATYSGCDSGSAMISSRNTWLTQSIDRAGGAEVAGEVAPARRRSRARARRNAAMSARRKR